MVLLSGCVSKLVEIAGQRPPGDGSVTESGGQVKGQGMDGMALERFAQPSRTLRSGLMPAMPREHGHRHGTGEDGLDCDPAAEFPAEPFGVSPLVAPRHWIFRAPQKEQGKGSRRKSCYRDRRIERACSTQVPHRAAASASSDNGQSLGRPPRRNTALWLSQLRGRSSSK